MQYKIRQLRVRNFKCFDDSRFYEFNLDESKNPIILSGPNGFGKTTFFDAIELIFSKSITRLETGIEKKNTNLGKNILLNKADVDGYVVLTLVNENEEYLTIFALISKSVHKLDVDNAIEYGAIKENIETENLLNVLSSYSDWKDELVQHNILNFSSKHFNVYYYVSQAESVHFLKRTITDRKDAMNVLLNTTDISDKIELINSKLIGKRTNSKSLINDKIANTNLEIDKNVSLIKKIISTNGDVPETEMKYEKLLEYSSNMVEYFWDQPDLTSFSTAEINKAILDIEGLHSLYLNKTDYEKIAWNTKIKNLLKGEAITDYIKYHEFLIEGKISKEKIGDRIKLWDRWIRVFTYSGLLRADTIDLEKYNRKDLERLNDIIPDAIDFDLKITDNIVSEVNNLQGLLTGRQKLVKDLEAARSSLFRAMQNYDKDSSVCPYCNQKYDDVDELKTAYENVAKSLDLEGNTSLIRIREKQDELLELLKCAKEKVSTYLGEYNDQKRIDELLVDKSDLQEFLGDSSRVLNVEFLALAIGDVEPEDGCRNEELKVKVQSILSDKLKGYSNPNFMSEYQKHNYEKIINKYSDIIQSQQEKLLSKQCVENKVNYLKKIIWEKENAEISELKNNLKQQLIHLEKLNRIRENLDKLQKTYVGAIEEYKNIVLKKLRVPLLIYTGKILQDYQNGLGVFINKDEMRFVATGDAKHDILNTFSSGQLSGFVLAFLFSMNKQYIKESTDDIGFILIDDPVQTMDDINISSLIEVLRNDFADKQIILSTHETEKENYILYKFYKYNQIGQSFNVKEQLYGV